MEKRMIEVFALFSKFIVSYLYKWILPIMVVILTVFFADKNQNDFFRYFFGLLLCIVDWSVPLNFENPKPERFSFLSKNILYVIVGVSIQAILLSVLISGITGAFILWYFPDLHPFLLLISLSNGLFYFGTIIFEYFIVYITSYQRV